MSIETGTNHPRRILFLLLAWALFLICDASAQEGVRMGPSLGYEYGVPLTVSRDSGLINRYRFSGMGESSNHTLWFGSYLTFPALFGRNIDPSLRLSLALSSGRFISDPFFSDSIFNPTNLDSVRIRFEVFSTLSILQLEAPIHYRAASWATLGLGPWISYRLTSGFIQTEEILDSNIFFSDGRRERTVEAGESLGAEKFRYGILLSAAFPFRMFGHAHLRPEIYGRADMASIVEGLGGRSLSAGIGISLLFDPEARADTDPPLVDDTPEPPALRTSVDLYAGEGDATAVMQAQRTLHRTSMPVVPVIFFERGSAELPSRYAILSAEEADRFNRSSLVRLDPLGLYYQTLNLLGHRLRATPDATITLHGSISSEEPASLARARAEEVRSYLSERWGIAERRIAIEEGARGKKGEHEDMRRSVTITSGDAGTLLPVVAEWIVQDWRVPRIGVNRSIVAEAGVKEWTLTVRQGEDVVARHSSADLDTSIELGGAFVLRNGGGAGELVAELVAKDSTGRIGRAYDTLRVIREQGEGGARGEREVLAYMFIGNHPALPRTDGNDRLIDAISGALRAGANVVVTELQGRSAPPDPADASLTGVQVVGKLVAALQGENSRIDELRMAHAGKPRFGTDLPEQRLLSAGVLVVIDQRR